MSTNPVYLLILSISEDGFVGHSNESLQQGLAVTLDRRFTLSHVPLLKDGCPC